MNISTNMSTLGVDTTQDADKEKLMQTCKDLEGEFLKLMLKEMKKTIPKTDEQEAKSSGRDKFEDFYIDALVQDMEKEGTSLGLAQSMYDQFVKSNNL